MKLLSQQRTWTITVERNGEDWPAVQVTERIRIFPDKAEVRFDSDARGGLADELISVTITGPWQNQSVKHSAPSRTVKLHRETALRLFGTGWLHDVQMAGYAARGIT